MRVFMKKFSQDWQWGESFPWESLFQDRDGSLAEICIEVQFVERKLKTSVTLHVMHLHAVNYDQNMIENF